MHKGVTLELEKKTVRLLDKHRGDMPRDDYIINILDEYLRKEDNVNEAFNEHDFGEFMLDFKRFADSISTRLDRLEGLLNARTATDDTRSGVEDQPDTYQTTEVFNLEVEDGESVIFETLETDEDEVEVEVKDITGFNDENKNFDEIGTASVSSSSKKESDEFEYGCPYCNSTISSDATSCPSCGNKFDDDANQPTYYVGDEYDSEDDDAAIVEPLPTQQRRTGAYDPRPDHLKRKHGNDARHPSMSGFSPAKRSGSSYINPADVSEHQVRRCQTCGERMAYIDEIKRAYCFKCKKYEGARVPVRSSPKKQQPPEYRSTSKAVFTKSKPYVPPETNIPPRKTYTGKKKPLKDYHKYRS